jgi:hypothetical protein
MQHWAALGCLSPHTIRHCLSLVWWLLLVPDILPRASNMIWGKLDLFCNFNVQIYFEEFLDKKDHAQHCCNQFDALVDKLVCGLRLSWQFMPNMHANVLGRQASLVPLSDLMRAQKGTRFERGAYCLKSSFFLYV